MVTDSAQKGRAQIDERSMCPLGRFLLCNNTNRRISKYTKKYVSSLTIVIFLTCDKELKALSYVIII